MCCCSKGREKVEEVRSTGGWTRKQPRTDSVWAGTQADKAGSESMQRVKTSGWMDAPLLALNCDWGGMVVSRSAQTEIPQPTAVPISDS